MFGTMLENELVICAEHKLDAEHCGAEHTSSLVMIRDRLTLSFLALDLFQMLSWEKDAPENAIPIPRFVFVWNASSRFSTRF